MLVSPSSEARQGLLLAILAIVHRQRYFAQQAAACLTLVNMTQPGGQARSAVQALDLDLDIVPESESQSI